MTTNNEASSGGRRRVAAGWQEVLDVVLDLPAYPRWTKDVAQAEILSRTPSGDVDLARLRFAAGPFKDVVTLRYETTRRTDGARVAWHLVEAEHVAAMEGHYDLVADGDGTQVSYSLHARPNLPLHTALRRKVEMQIIAAALDALATRVDGVGGDSNAGR